MSGSDSELDYESADDGHDIDIENDADFDFLKDNEEIGSSKKESLINEETSVVTSKESLHEKEKQEQEKKSVNNLSNFSPSIYPAENEKEINQEKDLTKIENKQNLSEFNQSFQVQNNEYSEIKDDKNIEYEEKRINENVENSKNDWKNDAWEDTDLNELEELTNKNLEIETTSDKKFSQNERTNKLKDDKNAEIKEKNELIEDNKDYISLFNKVSNKNSNNSEYSGSWSWSKLSSGFLSTAVNITSNSISSVLETVEGAIGAPDPQELAVKVKSELKLAEEVTLSDTNKNKSNLISDDNWDNEEWFTMLPLNKLATTGLSVLETVGKKTIEAINEKDPNFKQTREFLKQVPANIVPIASQPNLSQLIREAQISTKNKSDQEKVIIQEKPSFNFYYDEFNGGVYFEALEMLSRQMEVKMEMNKLSFSDSVKTKLDYLDNLFDVDSSENKDSENSEDNQPLLDLKCFDINQFEFFVTKYVKKSRSKLIFQPLIDSFSKTFHSIDESTTLNELNNNAIKYFALIASTLVGFYQKSSQTFLVEQQNTKSLNNLEDIIETARVLNQITKLCTSCVNNLADCFSKKCKSISTEKLSNQIITNIFLEALNCNTYIFDSFALLLPIYKSQLIENSN